MSLLSNIGKLVDKLDIELVTKGKNIDVENIDVVRDIESMFSSIELTKLSDDEKVVYYYTHSNYLFVLQEISNEMFCYMKENSNFLKEYNNNHDFKYNNYFKRAYDYREAIKFIDSGTKLPLKYTSQIYVNYANLLLEMGRIIESIQVLVNRRNFEDNFPMADANLALKYYALAKIVTNNSNRRFIMDKSLEMLTKTLEKATEESMPKDILEKLYDWEVQIEKTIDQTLLKTKPWDKSEDVNASYKEWCAKNNLSLNYINIVCSKGNIDNLHIPNMGAGYFNEKYNMEYYSWFNTIKQEYNMARYFLYQIKDMENFSSLHESQNYNEIVNTLDYPAVGYKTELMKISIKTSFSILDKIGLFCCHFHEQEINVKHIDFHKWYSKIKLTVALKSPFKPLYWLSRDLDITNGFMKDIRLLRNKIEHRYLRVLEDYNVPLSEELEKQKYEYRISIENLEKKSYETLDFVRSAIFYLANGLNIEFDTFYNDPKRKDAFLPLIVDEYEDEWKN